MRQKAMPLLLCFISVQKQSFLIKVKGRPFKTSTVPRGKGSTLFSDLSTSYVLDMGREESKNGGKLSTS